MYVSLLFLVIGDVVRQFAPCAANTSLLLAAAWIPDPWRSARSAASLPAQRQIGNFLDCRIVSQYLAKRCGCLVFGVDRIGIKQNPGAVFDHARGKQDWSAIANNRLAGDNQRGWWLCKSPAMIGRVHMHKKTSHVGEASSTSSSTRLLSAGIGTHRTTLAVVPGCRGFAGPVPLPLWMRFYLIGMQCTIRSLCRQSRVFNEQATIGASDHRLVFVRRTLSATIGPGSSEVKS